MGDGDEQLRGGLGPGQPECAMWGLLQKTQGTGDLQPCRDGLCGPEPLLGIPGNSPPLKRSPLLSVGLVSERWEVLTNSSLSYWLPRLVPPA